ncbi:unnamed protein product [Citrullus colocynthis]|uniref:Uncharacterized protein n=1 Tax=Citrullus colocynthis TaxID=252529 RepID=A0ABP0ZBT6_9ROSI
MRNPDIFKHGFVECGGTAKAKQTQLVVHPRTPPLLSSLSARSFRILLLRSQAHYSRLRVFHLPRSPRRNPHRDLPPILRFCTEYLKPISSQVALNLVE